MPYTMTISPDFKPDLISGWYIFNTWLQKQIDESIHIEMVNDFKELSNAIDSDSIDLIYANPCDMTKLIREKSFTPIAKPVGTHDEAVIITREDNPVSDIESLPRNIKRRHDRCAKCKHHRRDPAGVCGHNPVRYRNHHM